MPEATVPRAELLQLLEMVGAMLPEQSTELETVLERLRNATTLELLVDGESVGKLTLLDASHGG